MALRLIYQMFSKLLGWIVLRTRSDTTKDIEILVLRHQLAVLRRRTPRPRTTWTDHALIAALTRLLPVRRRLGLLVTPATIHGELAGLGYQIGASTIWTILHTAGIDPSPRRAGPFWTEFPRARAHAILACWHSGRLKRSSRRHSSRSAVGRVGLEPTT